MFIELMPVISNRPLTITIAPVAEGKLRVCVVPQPQEKDRAINDKIGHRKEVEKIPDTTIQGLTTPLSVTGTAEELDRELSATLKTYVASHEQLQQGIARVTVEIAEALKALDERDKAKKPKTPSAPKPTPKDDKTIKGGSDNPAGTLPLNWIAQTAVPPAVSASDAPAEPQPAQTKKGEE